MKSKTRPLSILLVSALSLLFLGSTTSTALAKPPAHAGGGGGGGNDGGSDDGGSETTLPPIVYEVQYFDFPFAHSGVQLRDSNESGQVVGQYDYDLDGDGVWEGRRAWFYDGVSEFAVDLNSIVDGIPDGWEIYFARAINDYGDIGATIAEIAAPTPKKLKAALIDMNANSPTLHLVPDELISDDTLTADITNWGDLLGSYRRADGTDGVYVYNFGNYDPNLAMLEPVDLGMHASWDALYMNDNGEIAGYLQDQRQTFRIAADGSVETFDLSVPSALNELGGFLGRYQVKAKGNKYENYPYVYGQQLTVFTDAVAGLAPQALNDSRDFVQGSGTSIYLYHQSDWGLVDIIALLDPTEQQFFIDNPVLPRVISARQADTDFPVIHGQVGDLGFTLVPVPAP